MVQQIQADTAAPYLPQGDTAIALAAQFDAAYRAVQVRRAAAATPPMAVSGWRSCATARLPLH